MLLLPQHHHTVEAFSPISEEASETWRDGSYVKKYRLSLNIYNRTLTAFLSSKNFAHYPVPNEKTICVRSHGVKGPDGFSASGDR